MCSLVLLGTIASVLLISFRSAPTVVRTNLENLPMEIAGFTGIEDMLSKSVYEELNADKHVYRHYVSMDGSQVDLYIGYYGTAKGGRTPHTPHACLPAAGWGIIDSHNIRLSVKRYGKPLSVNYMLTQKADTYQILLHWYQSAATKVLATGVERNIDRFIGRLIRNRNDGAFVRISALSDKTRVEQTKRIVSEFAKEVLGLLPEFWPVEE